MRSERGAYWMMTESNHCEGVFPEVGLGVRNCRQVRRN
jgi:hypothetical protein